MQIDLEDLRRHYASLPDEALLDIDPHELSEIAQKCYDEELARRKLTSESLESLDLEGFDNGVGGEPDWLEAAACVCAFEKSRTSSPSDAENAREVLQAAGIPCQISVRSIDPPSVDPQPRSEYCIMVPNAMNLRAISVLDREIFNEKVEAGWRTHLEVLSDEELRALDLKTICSGLLDQVERLKRVYNDEITRRKGF